MSPNIDELREVIRKLHGASATHIESVPIKETLQGRTVWEGMVEVFDLQDHANARRVYTWSHTTDDPVNPKRHVTVLHLGPIESALDAVRAVIVKEFRDANPIEAQEDRTPEVAEGRGQRPYSAHSVQRC